MKENEKPLVSICIPHWQVRELITISLRALRKHTREIPIEVIVVDNGSDTDSLDYLRGLRWIRLIERGKDVSDHWIRTIATAWDVGFSASRGEYFITMHNDTIVKRSDWLERMLQPMEEDSQCGVVEAWKLELEHPLYSLLKKATDLKKVKLWLRRTFLRDAHAQELKRELCPRDYCALYRSEPIRREGLKFDNANGTYKGYTPGERMYYQLKEHGYRAEVLQTREMIGYMEHIAHATAGLRPDLRRLNHRWTRIKVGLKLRRFFNSARVKELIADSSLDA